MDGEQISGIAAAVGAVVALVSTFVARWTKTNAANPWYVRLANVCDVTQIFDSTRRLED